MANLKNITELPLAESADGLNLIVEQDGVAKRVAADAVSGSGGADLDLWFNFETGEYVVFAGSYDSLVEKMVNNAPFSVRAVEKGNDYNYYPQKITEVNYKSDIEQITVFCDNGSYYYLYKDGRIERYGAD